MFVYFLSDTTETRFGQSTKYIDLEKNEPHLLIWQMALKLLNSR